MDQSPTPPSFATYTSSLISTIASSSSPLPQHTEPSIIARDGLNDDVVVSNSLRPVSAPSAVDAALVAGSVSVLISVGCILGFIFYKRKRHGQGSTDFIIQSRAMKAPRKADGEDDVEASAKSLMQTSAIEANKNHTSGASYSSRIKSLATSAQPGSHHSSAFQLSTTNTVASFMTPLVTYANQRPQESPTLSTTSTLYPPTPETSSGGSLPYTPKRSELNDHTVHGVRLSELQEEDLGSMVLSSLQNDETFRTIEPCDDHFATSRSVFPITKDLPSEYGFFLDSSCNLVTSMGEDGLLEDATSSETPLSSPTLSFGSQSLATSDSPPLTTMQSLAIPDSPTLSSSPHSILPLLSCDSDLTFHSDPADSTKGLPRLLELKLDSEVDLRSCLGLDRNDAGPAGITEHEITDYSSDIPDLVPTDSQETVTGSDESYDHNPFRRSSICPYAYKSQQEYEDHDKPISPTEDHYSAELTLSVFAPAVTRSFLHPITASPQTATASVVTDNQPRTLSPSPSFASSSNSVTTLQLPSYCTSEQSALIEEVLPPPSIIVSVPTDGSLILDSYGSAQFSTMSLATGNEEQRVCSIRKKRCSMDATKVIYDPVDEVEEEAWEEAYERTCFVETSHSRGTLTLAMEESYHGFSESWMASSESSELDIEGAIASFPLPPVYPYTSKEQVVKGL